MEKKKNTGACLGMLNSISLKKKKNVQGDVSHLS